MFGSKRAFPYLTDESVEYGLVLDESNTELINPSAGIPSSNVDGLPQDIRRRKVKLVAGNGSTKTVVVLTRPRFDAIIEGQAFAAPSVGEENPAQTSFVVQQKIPERVLRRAYGIDTGKNDGDQP